MKRHFVMPLFGVISLAFVFIERPNNWMIIQEAELYMQIYLPVVLMNHKRSITRNNMKSRFRGFS